MNEDRFKIDDLSARLTVDPQFVKELLTEMAEQVTKEYLTIEELAKRLSWEEKTVKNKMEAGVFQRSVHWFHPKGIRPRFKWSAVVAWLEGREKQAGEKSVSEKAPPPCDTIPMARGYLLGQRSQKKTGVRP